MYAARLPGLSAGLALVASLMLSLPAPAAVTLPNGGTVERVDFERHVMGLFGRAGCNSGSCHGSFQGKGGFRLSLFGYDPEKDYTALTREVLGRRLDPVNPERSLLLLKATGMVDHGGLRRFGEGSWQHQLFREWIQGGANWRKGSGDVKSIRVNPPEYAFDRPRQTGQLKVLATFADGDEEDITPFCDFRALDDAVADVTPLGRVTSHRPGDTGVVVIYRGQVLTVRIMVPREAESGFVYPKVPEVNYIDREVFAKLRRLNIVPSDLSGDLEFLRRVTLDTIGTLPTPDEVRKFLADDDPNKRERKIDELLAHPMHAALWATKFCDITGNNTDALEVPQQLRPKLSQQWHDWLRKRMAENVPYDEIVRGILCATSRDGLSPEEWIKQAKATDEAATKGFSTPYAERPSLDLFWRRQQNVPIDQWGEKTAAAFLGIRLECAQCHKHPFDRWTQHDYRAYANLFAQVNFGESPEAQKAIRESQPARPTGAQANQVRRLREVFVGAPRGLLPDPDTGRGALTPKALAGPTFKLDPGKDVRVELWHWMRQPDNPFFARSFVNRIWGHYFGVGIVDPVDDFALGNPPSNPRLLDALAQDFLDHKFDIRHVERTILLSRTYQLSSTTNETNKLDKRNYAHAYVRPMMAEVVVDVLNAAIGVTENYGNDAPAGCRAIEAGASRITNQTVNYAFRIFGRPPRTTACDCERAADPALPQKLFLMADGSLKQKLDAPRNRVKELISEKKGDAELLDELFLATLTRYPTQRERELFLEYRKNSRSAEAACTDALWALINTTEFIFNH
jgi:hypothetical protein